MGLAGAVRLDQAELAPAAVLRGRTLDTRAGKSSSWKEDDFLGWAEYAGVMGEATLTTERLGKSSSFRALGGAGAAGGADLTLEEPTAQRRRQRER